MTGKLSLQVQRKLQQTLKNGAHEMTSLLHQDLHRKQYSPLPPTLEKADAEMPTSFQKLILQLPTCFLGMLYAKLVEAFLLVSLASK